MIEILTAPDHVVAFRLAGEVTKGDYEQVIPLVEAKLDAGHKLGIFVDVTGLDRITAPAVLKDTAYSFSKLGDWKRFSRVAFVAHQDWVENLVGVGDTLMPGIEAEVFDPDKADAAMEWTSQPSSED